MYAAQQTTVQNCTVCTQTESTYVCCARRNYSCEYIAHKKASIYAAGAQCIHVFALLAPKGFTDYFVARKHIFAVYFTLAKHMHVCIFRIRTEGVVKDELRGLNVGVIVGLVAAAEECASSLLAEEELEDV